MINNNNRVATKTKAIYFFVVCCLVLLMNGCSSIPLLSNKVKIQSLTLDNAQLDDGQLIHTLISLSSFKTNNQEQNLTFECVLQGNDADSSFVCLNAIGMKVLELKQFTERDKSELIKKIYHGQDFVWTDYLFTLNQLAFVLSEEKYSQLDDSIFAILKLKLSQLNPNLTVTKINQQQIKLRDSQQHAWQVENRGSEIIVQDQGLKSTVRVQILQRLPSL